MFDIGDLVRTTYWLHCLKGKTERFGTVVGYCRNNPGPGRSDKFVRVTWQGWKPQSSVAVRVDYLTLVSKAVQ